MKKYLTLENLLLISMIGAVIVMSLIYCRLQQRASHADPYKELKDSLKAYGWPDSSVKVNPPDTLHLGGVNFGAISSTAPAYEGVVDDSFYGNADALEDSTLLNHSKLIKRK